MAITESEGPENRPRQRAISELIEESDILITTSTRLFEETYTRLIGEAYHEIVRDRQKIEDCLSHPDPIFRRLALQLYLVYSNVAITGEIIDKISDLVRADSEDSVRCSAIDALLSIYFRTKDNKLPRLFSRLALDHKEKESIRKTAYARLLMIDRLEKRSSGIAGVTKRSMESPDQFDLELLYFYLLLDR